MKKVLGIAVIFCALQGFAQQLPVYSLYGLNPFVVNPAFAGSEYYWDFTVQHRSQWLGFENGPSTQLLSTHSRVDGTPSGFGGHFYNDRNGILGNFGASLAYAYHVELSESMQLSFGASASYTQYRLLADRVQLYHSTDNLIPGATGKDGAFNANFGTLLYADNFYFGLSALNLLSPKLDYASGANTPIERHYYLQTGGWIPVATNGSIQPALIVDYLKGNPIGINAQVVYEYVDIVKGGIGYRWKDAISLIAGVKIYDELYLNYAYDLGISKISSAHSGSHEIMLTYKFYYNPIHKNSKARYNIGKVKKRAD